MGSFRFLRYLAKRELEFRTRITGVQKLILKQDIALGVTESISYSKHENCVLPIPCSLAKASVFLCRFEGIFIVFCSNI